MTPGDLLLVVVATVAANFVFVRLIEAMAHHKPFLWTQLLLDFLVSFGTSHYLARRRTRRRRREL